MTNGEKLCIDFPNMRYSISEHRVITTIGVAASFDLDWWNAEYQEPRKGEWQLTDDEMFVYCPFCYQTDYTRPIDASWKYCPECGARLD